jgi:hypothetical protein
VFAASYGVPGLKIESIDQLHKFLTVTYIIPMHDIKYIYEDTPEGAPLRGLIATVYALSFQSRESFMGIAREYFTVDFLRDVL